MKQGKTEELMTKKQLAAVFHVSTRTIETYCAKRLITFVRIPGGIRFRPEDVDRFIQGRIIHAHQPLRPAETFSTSYIKRFTTKTQTMNLSRNAALEISNSFLGGNEQ